MFSRVYSNQNRKVAMILSRTDCEKILRNDETLIDFSISKYSEKVCGFLAEHHRLTLTSKDESDGEIKTRSYFLKTIPDKMPCHNEYVGNMDIFRKEILMYDILEEFLPLVSKPFAPAYYFSVPNKCLVLEDMRYQGYQNCNTAYLDVDKMTAALGAIARLHAASIIFEEQRSINNPYRMNEHFPEALQERTFAFDESKVRYFWCHAATKCLEDLSVYFSNIHLASKLRTYIFSEEGFRTFLRPSEKYRNVICHDDLWCNNFIFNEQNDCIIVDFQLTRFTPPVCDVLLALYINLDTNSISQNMNMFMNCYYDFLSYELSLHNISISNVIPKVDFFASAEDFKLPILIECGMYGTNVFIPDDLSLEIISSAETFEKFYLKNRSYYILKEFRSNDEFRSRYSQVLLPLFEILENI